MAKDGRDWLQPAIQEDLDVKSQGQAAKTT
jgi:hypothetical protein